MPVNVTAKFNMPSFGTKQVAKAKKVAKKVASKPAPKPVKKAVKAVKAVKKAVKASAPLGTRAGGAGYRKYAGDALWLPNTSRPDWLDGSLPGSCYFG
jgi:light-harvesting complex II chlorophyll a/b binding protein 4